MHLLGVLIGMKLQADRPFLDSLWLRVAPVNDLGPIDRHADAVALGQDFQVVPIVLLADFLSRLTVDWQTIPPKEIVHSPPRRKHDQVAGIGVFIAMLGLITAPEGDAGMHFRLYQLERAGQPKIGKVSR